MRVVKQILVLAGMSVLMLIPTLVWAHGEEGAVVDGLKISWEIMTMDEAMKVMGKDMMGKEGHQEEMKGMGDMGKMASHHVSVQIVDAATSKEVKDAKVIATSFAPNGDEEKKVLYTMTIEGKNHYMEDFTFNQKGEYKIQLLIRRAGKDIKYNFDYEAH
jgi:hypothetical protein